MKPLNYLRTLAIFLSLLVVSLPITFAEEFNRVYDGDGNLISDGKYYREYDGLNQLIRVRLGNTTTSPLLEEYKWHPFEERIVVKKVFYSGVYNYTIYYPTKEYVRIVNSSGTFDEKYIYQDGVLVAQIDADGNKQFIHNDHESSNTLITDINGNVLENTFYSPYGEIISGGAASRFDYEGKEFDSLVEDYDFNFRKYKPDVPIFNQPDDEINDPYNPQYLNRYSFELNNPYRYTDPDGHYIETALDIAFIASDLAAISEDPSDITNYLALGADIVGALLPGATGLGLGVKAIDKAIDAGKASKAAGVLKQNIQNSKAAEATQRAIDGGIKKTFTTPSGERRIIDSFKPATRQATEVKTGVVRNTQFNRNQILKDVSLVKAGQITSPKIVSYRSPTTGQSGFTKGIINFINDLAKKTGIKIKTDTKKSSKKGRKR